MPLSGFPDLLILLGEREGSKLSGFAVVVMPQAVQDGTGADGAVVAGSNRFSFLEVILCGDVLEDALMRTKVIVVIDILLQHVSQVIFGKEDEMIGALAA